MNKAIKRAIEGGYRDYTETSSSSTQKYHSDILLDPFFWQALAKSEGWEDGNGSTWWQYQMHRFIDHIIEGKEINSFFDNLLKK